MTKIETICDYNLDVENRTIYFQNQTPKETDSVNIQSVSSFCKNLDFLSDISSDPITIKMFAIEGGCWYSGMIMYEYIYNCPSYITIEAYSLLCSMGTVILQAADNRLVCRNMEMMVHFGSSELSGDFLAVKSYAEFTKNSHNKMIDIYSERCQNGKFFKDGGYTLNKVKNYLRTKIKDRGDFWMNAEESVNYGFCDSIIERKW